MEAFVVKPMSLAPVSWLESEQRTDFASVWVCHMRRRRHTRREMTPQLRYVAGTNHIPESSKDGVAWAVA
jgi:hypothetical protein